MALDVPLLVCRPPKERKSAGGEMLRNGDALSEEGDGN